VDIVSLPIEYDKKSIDSRFRLVTIASQRARELSLGSASRVPVKTKRVTTSALLEAISGKIEFITGEDAAVAKEKAEKIDYKKLIEQKRMPITDLSELEKDLKIYLYEKGAAERAIEELFTEGEEAEEAAEEEVE
jgi:DNA-directed RNA polymerase subunit omega